MLDIKNTLRNFLKNRGLVLNTKKPKILFFDKKGKGEKEKWEKKGEDIDKVQRYKYLVFILNRKGEGTDHIKKISKKGRIATNKVWSLEECM